jgi:hypothetical protein
MGDILSELEMYLLDTPEEKKLSDWESLRRYASPENITPPTTLMVGRFQPFTVTDLENLKEIREDTGNPSVLMYIRSHQWYANTPFKSATVREMLDRVKETYPDLVSSVMCSEKWDPSEVSDLLSKNGMRADRVVESDHNSLKAAITRLALTMGSKNEFKRCTPECIHDMYGILREEIKGK